MGLELTDCRVINYYLIISKRAQSSNFLRSIIRTGANPVILGVRLSAGCHCSSADCKRGRKKGAARKMSKSVEKLFDTF